MLFSATFPVTVKQFKDKFLRKPYIVNLMSELTLKGISQVSGIWTSLSGSWRCGSRHTYLMPDGVSHIDDASDAQGNCSSALKT